MQTATNHTQAVAGLTVLLPGRYDSKNTLFVHTLPYLRHCWPYVSPWKNASRTTVWPSFIIKSNLFRHGIVVPEG